jgi:hypothetical protein
MAVCDGRWFLRKPVSFDNQQADFFVDGKSLPRPLEGTRFPKEIRGVPSHRQLPSALIPRYVGVIVRLSSSNIHNWRVES